MSQKVQTSYEDEWFSIKPLPLIPELIYFVDLKEIRDSFIYTLQENDKMEHLKYINHLNTILVQIWNDSQNIRCSDGISNLDVSGAI